MLGWLREAAVLDVRYLAPLSQHISSSFLPLTRRPVDIQFHCGWALLSHKTKHSFFDNEFSRCHLSSPRYDLTVVEYPGLSAWGLREADARNNRATECSSPDCILSADIYCFVMETITLRIMPHAVMGRTAQQRLPHQNDQAALMNMEAILSSLLFLLIAPFTVTGF